MFLELVVLVYSLRTFRNVGSLLIAAVHLVGTFSDSIGISLIPLVSS